MFPGFKDKIWAQLPSKLRTTLIQRENASFEAEARSVCVTQNNRMRMLNQQVLDRLAPSVKNVEVDLKRQMARGTFVVGRSFYLPLGKRNRFDFSKAENVFEPFTKEEMAKRNMHRGWRVSLLAGAALLWLISDPRQEPMVVYCGGTEAPAPPLQPFWFKSAWHSSTIPNVRRGYEVYRKVCSTCHSMNQLHFRHLVNEVLPEKRMKQIAASYDVVDGPNETGEMFTRPGILTDAFPSPYPNDEAARYANNGAVPPDLSIYASCKFDGPDYIFAILTGYRDPPEGVTLRPGLYYNTYFVGGSISMPPPLSDEIIEYEDGTPATHSQLAKDVVEFIVWTSEPVTDDKKRFGIKASMLMFFGALCSGIWTRFMFMGPKTRRIDYGKPVF